MLSLRTLGLNRADARSIAQELYVSPLQIDSVRKLKKSCRENTFAVKALLLDQCGLDECEITLLLNAEVDGFSTVADSGMSKYRGIFCGIVCDES